MLCSLKFLQNILATTVYGCDAQIFHGIATYIAAAVVGLKPEAICFSLMQPFVVHGCKKIFSGRKSVVVYFSDHS